MTILNFLPVAKGGGLQNALSFLTTLDLSKDEYFVLCRKDSPIETVCRERNIGYKSVKRRMAFELFGARKLFPHGSVCFTIFGPPVLSTAGYWNNICGVAYSNLFYPEIDFWGHLGAGRKFAKHANDRIRKSTIKLADSWIFETKLLAQLAIDFGFPEERVFHVPMAVSKIVQQGATGGTKRIPNSPRKTILYLGSAHPNKRQHLVPEIAAAIERQSPGEYQFVLTMATESDYAKQVMQQVESMNLQQVVVNLGPIPATDVAGIIKESNAMCLLSVLESFSNNYVEAWAMKRPLFVTDSPWSRDSCDEGVVYIDPTDPSQTAERIDKLLRDPDQVQKLVVSGSATLNRYPTAERKTELYLECIHHAVELGPCPKSEKAEISYRGN